MKGKTLCVQMLGGFSMYYGGGSFVLNKTGSSKSVRLLQMLLLSMRGGISKNELIDSLYGWSENADTANRNKNLNNLIYRLKGQLISGGLPEDEYIELSDGMCSFRCGVPLELDVRQFEKMIEEARECGGEEERFTFLRKANEMYRGELLPGNHSDTWFFHKSNYYKEMYMYTVEELEKEYLRTKDYKNRLLLYTRASAVYPFENWQTKLIQCNLEVYRYEEAMDIYNNTMELYAQEMGTPPTSEMQRCFEELELLDEDHKRNMAAPGGWRDMDRIFMNRKDDIKRAIFEEKSRNGAYYCTYPSFVDYCRMVVRAKERNEFNAVLMFLTLSQRERKEMQRQFDLPGQMTLLKEVIGKSLRCGDAYTRYGNRHFILMLAKTGIESCSAIFRRIETSYVQNTGKGELWYYADMTQDLTESVL